LNRRRVVPYACVAVAVALANMPALVHLVTVDPINLDSGLASSLAPWLHGQPTIDGNAGFLMQALGHRVTTDWLGGHIPWWNPYEGVGVPLAGDMQSGALFLPTILTGLSDGLLYMQVGLELLAGWCTFALLARLGVGRTVATAAGVVFGLCGTFAWFSIEPIRVLAFLPLCLLGAERSLSAAREDRAWGWRLLAVGVAGTVFGGFPETILLDLLFVAWWAVLRGLDPGRQRWRPLLRKLAAGVAAGVALSAPLWVAFAGYSGFANTGDHAAGGYALVTLHARDLGQLILPYSIGTIFGFHSVGPTDAISVFWGNVGGYLDATLAAGVLVGLVGRRNRTLRLGLGLWLAVCLARTYGFAPVVHLLALVPGVRLTAFYRYADPTWELAAVVLTGLGLDDVARGRIRVRALWIGVGVAAAGTVWAAVSAWPTLTSATGPRGAMEAHRHLFVAGSLAFAVAMLGLLAAGGYWAGPRRFGAASGAVTGGASDGASTERSLPIGTEEWRGSRDARRRWGRAMMAGAVALEAVVLLGFTYLSAPRSATVGTGAVTWLQANLGSYRFATLGPIQPNYGSYFGIAEMNANELPLPKAWTDYVARDLDSNIIPFEFTGGYRSDPDGPSPAEELTTLVANYEAVGVRYVVVPASGTDPTGAPYPAPGSPPWPAGPRLVYHDDVAQIWELGHPAPAFSLAPAPASADSADGGPGACRVSAHGWDEAEVHCDRPSTLIRRVQYAPGWTATVGHSAVPVGHDGSGPPGLFQAVPVPAGSTTVRFTYLPPHEVPAALVSVLVALGLLASVILTVTASRRWRAPRRHRHSAIGGG
jgi:hypothetical protein